MLPEFSDKKNITWNFIIFEGSDVGYNIVIFWDLMLELGMDIYFSKKSVSWEVIEIQIQDFNKLR